MDTLSEGEKLELQLLHKNLRNASWEKRSNRTPEYNCIAFVLGIQNQRWQPEPLHGDYWPEGIPQSNTDDAWIALFERFKFVRCSDGNFEDGYEKIVIYADDESPTHVAKLISRGIWHSKMGNLADIIHPIDALNYGEPRFFLKRSLPAKRPSRAAQRRALKK